MKAKGSVFRAVLRRMFRSGAKLSSLAEQHNVKRVGNTSISNPRIIHCAVSRI